MEVVQPSKTLFFWTYFFVLQFSLIQFWSEKGHGIVILRLCLAKLADKLAGTDKLADTKADKLADMKADKLADKVTDKLADFSASVS
ncbi:hypothetical protein OROMI_028800 [Orobanche minor]